MQRGGSAKSSARFTSLKKSGVIAANGVLLLEELDERNRGGLTIGTFAESTQPDRATTTSCWRKWSQCSPRKYRYPTLLIHKPCQSRRSYYTAAWYPCRERLVGQRNAGYRNTDTYVETNGIAEQQPGRIGRVYVDQTILQLVFLAGTVS
jgi:hypothetical protein